VPPAHHNDIVLEVILMHDPNQTRARKSTETTG